VRTPWYNQLTRSPRFPSSCPLSSCRLSTWAWACCDTARALVSYLDAIDGVFCACGLNLLQIKQLLPPASGFLPLVPFRVLVCRFLVSPPCTRGALSPLSFAAFGLPLPSTGSAPSKAKPNLLRHWMLPSSSVNGRASISSSLTRTACSSWLDIWIPSL